MPDRYNVAIRRIRESDQTAQFKTKREVFNLCNESGTLKEYWESDTQSGGVFSVYLLIEEKSQMTIGLIRTRDEVKGADPQIPELSNRPAVYLSRLGILPEKEDLHLARVLHEYFFFLVKSKLKEHTLTRIVAYLKCPEDLKEFYASFGSGIIREIHDDKWGKGLVMATELFFEEVEEIENKE